MIKYITSKDNSEIRYIKKLLAKSSFRKAEKLYIAEGRRTIFDTEARLIKKIYVAKSVYEKNIINSDKNLNKIVVVDDSIFYKISDTKNSQGYLATVKIEKFDIDKELSSLGFVLILDSLADPGNMGTIIRTSEAAGIDAIITLNCVDIYNPKVVRSSMGSISRQKIFCLEKVKDVLEKIQNEQFSIVSSSLSDSIDYTEVVYTNKVALVLGSEANGIREDLLNNSDLKIKIDMCGEIESLNVAVAAGILMYDIKNKMQKLDF